MIEKLTEQEVQDKVGPDYIHQLMLFLAKADCDGEGIYPRVTRDGSLVIVFNCGDLFYWATADGEDYTPDDVDLLNQCYNDLNAADPEEGEYYWRELFCCRKRGMRPQYPCFRVYDRERCGYFEDRLKPAVRALFDALGPDGSDRHRG
jgi:hypothetical protein